MAVGNCLRGRVCGVWPDRLCRVAQLTLWLLAAKGANVAVLLWLRRIVMRRYYPKAKVY